MTIPSCLWKCCSGSPRLTAMRLLKDMAHWLEKGVCAHNMCMQQKILSHAHTHTRAHTHSHTHTHTHTHTCTHITTTINTHTHRHTHTHILQPQLIHIRTDIHARSCIIKGTIHRYGMKLHIISPPVKSLLYIRLKNLRGIKT